MNYKIFDTANDVVLSLADAMLALSKTDKPVHISLSGGSTPKLLFSLLAKAPYAEEIVWANLHFWWGDERCVAPNDPESNYGEADNLLFSHIVIPEGNIHRIIGESDPETEAKRYAEEIREWVPAKNGLPAFDWIILGMGTDGHTASLFPHKTDFDEPELTLVASHPESGQLRVSKSAKLIENADRVTYLVLGESKAQVLKEIQQTPSDELPYPAAKVKSAHGQTEWFLDSQAATLLV